MPSPSPIICLCPALHHLWHRLRFLLPGPLPGPAGPCPLGPAPPKEEGPLRGAPHKDNNRMAVQSMTKGQWRQGKQKCEKDAALFRTYALFVQYLFLFFKQGFMYGMDKRLVSSATSPASPWPIENLIPCAIITRPILVCSDIPLSRIGLNAGWVSMQVKYNQRQRQQPSDLRTLPVYLPEKREGI